VGAGQVLDCCQCWWAPSSTGGTSWLCISTIPAQTARQKLP